MAVSSVIIGDDLIRGEGTVELWKHRRPKSASSESQLERERKRALAKLYPSSTDELVRIVAESEVKPRRLRPSGDDPSA